MTFAAMKAGRTYRMFDRYLEQVGRHADREAKNRLVIEARRAANAYRSGAGEAAALAEIQDMVWSKYLNLVWFEVVTGAGRLMLAELGGAADPTAFDRTARQYLDRNAAARGAGIAETSRGLVAKSIAAGVEARETAGDIARRIEADAGEMAVWRSATIGATESHAAGNFGAWAAALQTLRNWHKVWTAPRLAGVTCDQHKTAQGQRRGLREAFHVGNDYEPAGAVDLLNYPGDGERGARPSNVINCRCQMEFIRP